MSYTRKNTFMYSVRLPLRWKGRVTSDLIRQALSQLLDGSTSTTKKQPIVTEELIDNDEVDYNADDYSVYGL